jgi:hypothetical protein
VSRFAHRFGLRNTQGAHARILRDILRIGRAMTAPSATVHKIAASIRECRLPQ